MERVTLNVNDAAIVSVTKSFKMHSAHYLPNYVGACHKMHGHSYELFITVRGMIESSSGMVIDFREMKEVLNTHVINKLDHETLNDVLPFVNMTVENLVVWVFKTLEVLIKDGVFGRNVELKCVKIYETDTCYAEYGGC